MTRFTAAVLALVFASLALAQSAPSWRYYPMNTQNLDTGKVQSGLWFYVYDRADEGLSLPARVVFGDGTTVDGLATLYDSHATAAWFPIAEPLMAKLLDDKLAIRSITFMGRRKDNPIAGMRYEVRR